MRVLLDTRIALWLFAGDVRIAKIQPLILLDETDVFVSTASLRELAIKISNG